MTDGHYPREQGGTPRAADLSLAQTAPLEPSSDVMPRMSGSPVATRQTPLYAQSFPADSTGAHPLPTMLPARPTTLTESGLEMETLVELALKHVASAGSISGGELAERLCLPLAGIVEEVISALRRDGLVEHLAGTANPTLVGAAGIRLRSTERGTQLDRAARERSGYVGPAPVSLKAYERMMRHQAMAARSVKRSEVWRRMAHLVLPDETVDGIGAALESGGPLLFYGHPGNGKTATATAIAHMYLGGVLIPHAIEIDGYVVRVFDAGIHHPLPLESLSGAPRIDERWVYCATPFVRAGIELRLEQLDLHFNSDQRYYDCPTQLKAAGGVLLIDDLGGQRDRVDDLLNRLLEPFASGVDSVTTIHGRQIPIPFTSLLIFATSQQPNELSAEVVLRRLPCKIHIPDPTEEHFHEIFHRVCQRAGIEYSQSGFEHLRERWYRMGGRSPRACHAGELVRLVGAAARYYGVAPALSVQLIDAAAKMYFG